MSVDDRIRELEESVDEHWSSFWRQREKDREEARKDREGRHREVMGELRKINGRVQNHEGRLIAIETRHAELDRKGGRAAEARGLDPRIKVAGGSAGGAAIIYAIIELIRTLGGG